MFFGVQARQCCAEDRKRFYANLGLVVGLPCRLKNMPMAKRDTSGLF